MRRNLGIQVQEKRNNIQKRKVHLRKNKFSASLQVKIRADNGKCYSAKVLRYSKNCRFSNVFEMKRDQNKPRVSLVDYSRFTCTLAARSQGRSGLIGAEVIVRDNKNLKLVKGKIVSVHSVHPYIIGTPSGDNPLPPVDE